jgi:hypothetical protein
MKMDAVHDAALVAAAEVERAEAQFLSVPATQGGGGLNTAFLKAESAWTVAEQAFAEVVPSTRTGALRKLAALRGLVSAIAESDDCLELRHIDSLATYLQRE